MKLIIIKLKKILKIRNEIYCNNFQKYFNEKNFINLFINYLIKLILIEVMS